MKNIYLLMLFLFLIACGGADFNGLNVTAYNGDLEEVKKIVLDGADINNDFVNDAIDCTAKIEIITILCDYGSSFACKKIALRNHIGIS